MYAQAKLHSKHTHFQYREKLHDNSSHSGLPSFCTHESPDTEVARWQIIGVSISADIPVNYVKNKNDIPQILM